MTLTHQNHFRWTYDGKNWSTDRTHHYEKFQTSVGRAETDIRDWRAANKLTAETIRNSTSEPLWVFYSGGMDSEIAILAFQDAHIPVNVAIIRFANGLNDFDVNRAIEFCGKMAIVPKIIDLDLLDFMSNGNILPYAAATQATWPSMAVLCRAIEQINGYPILGGGIALTKEFPDGFIPGVDPLGSSTWNFIRYERFVGMDKFLLSQKRDGCPQFFRYMPEQIWSLLQSADIQQLVTNQYPNIYDIRQPGVKFAIFGKLYPELENRLRYTGFEKVNADPAMQKAHLAAMQSAASVMPFYSPFSGHLIRVADLAAMLRPMSLQSSPIPLGPVAVAV